MTQEARQALQFCTRKEAAAAAKAIGWQVNDARPVEIMGFCLYVIMDEHCSMLTPTEYAALLEARAGVAAGRGARSRTGNPGGVDKSYSENLEQMCDALAEHADWLAGGSGARMCLHWLDLSGVSLLAGADLREANLQHLVLEDADLEGARLDGAKLDAAILRGADLTGVSAERASFAFADCRAANFRGARLAKADFGDADLRGAHFILADLRGAYLLRANARGASMREADLRKANLRGADLRDADLRDADCSGADLRKVDLRDADTRGTRIGGAIMTGVRLR